MAERLTLKIIPPDGGNGALSVEDAMQQVLDAFKLLAAGSNGVVWKLVSATTNSPFTIVAEAVDSLEAAEQAVEFSNSMKELSAGRFPESWKRPALQVLASNFLRRNLENIAVTEVRLRNEPPVAFTAANIRPIVSLPEFRALMVEHTAPEAITKRQVGSIEGILVEVFTYRDKPALRVKERKSGREVTCVIPDYLAQTFSSNASVEDVWSHRRVTIRGMILYSATGMILRVEASHIEQAPVIKQPLPKLTDPNFTGGLSATEYLERFRAGEIG
jgi:hypothetical protein